MPDKLGMRYSGRPTIRPASAHDQLDLAFDVGAAVDAWWSDGWWEGVLTGFGHSSDEIHQVYIPSENLFLNVDRKNLRISRDWVGDQWVDIEPNPNVLSTISEDVSPDTKLSVTSTIKEAKSDSFPMSSNEVPTNIKLGGAEEDTPKLDGLASSDGLLKYMDQDNYEQQQLIKDMDKEDDGHHPDDINEKGNTDHHLGDDDVDDLDNNGINKDDGDDNDEVDNGDNLEVPETAGPICEAELMEVGA
ncbi:unnamed protein product [Ilex paraguariensis]|uniref:Agenet domain-containing protein n=1 Tax=Ilex paraguariensis TaxID=185542 RepID=A0ABC8SIA4_9AQUA